MNKLSSYIVINKLQPRTASYLSIVSRSGALTLPGTALVLIEVLPTGIVEMAANIALKAGAAKPSVFQLGGRVGYLAINSESVSDACNSGMAVVEKMGLELPIEPGKVVSSELISRLDHQHAFITNKLKVGSMCVPGESLYALECQPAPYAMRAANQAEAAADIKIVDFRFTGSMGRLIMSGKDEAIRVARDAAL